MHINPEFNLIGLTGIATDRKGKRIGSARVGKDEIGRILSEEFKTHHRTSFAAPIYNVVHEAFGIPKEVLANPTHFQKEEQVWHPWGMTMREMLQKVGSELFRHHVDSDFWVKSLASRTQGTSNWIVTDVRMDNEAAYIRRAGGVIIHVSRETELGSIRAHESEQQVEILPEDYHISNNGTLEQLSENLTNLISTTKE